MFEVKNFESKPLLGHTDKVYGIAISQDNKFIVSGGSDMIIRVWDRESRI